MDPMTGYRIVSTILMFAIFLGIAWWAYSGRRSARFHVAAHSVLQDDDAPGSLPSDGRAK